MQITLYNHIQDSKQKKKTKINTFCIFLSVLYMRGGTFCSSVTTVKMSGRGKTTRRCLTDVAGLNSPRMLLCSKVHGTQAGVDFPACICPKETFFQSSFQLQYEKIYLMTFASSKNSDQSSGRSGQSNKP